MEKEPDLMDIQNWVEKQKKEKEAESKKNIMRGTEKKMKINERIKSLREGFSLSQKKFAEMCGLASASISFYESGKREPTITALSKMSKVFKVPIDYIINGGDIEIEFEQYYVTVFNKLTLKDRKMILDLIERFLKEEEKFEKIKLKSDKIEYDKIV